MHISVYRYTTLLQYLSVELKNEWDRHYAFLHEKLKLPKLWKLLCHDTMLCSHCLPWLSALSSSEWLSSASRCCCFWEMREGCYSFCNDPACRWSQASVCPAVWACLVAFWHLKVWRQWWGRIYRGTVASPSHLLLQPETEILNGFHKNKKGLNKKHRWGVPITGLFDGFYHKVLAVPALSLPSDWLPVWQQRKWRGL